MAKLHEEVIVVKVSKLLKDTDEASVLLNTGILESLEAVVQELAGAGTLVEIQVA
jgi:hypothetical protein